MLVQIKSYEAAGERTVFVEVKNVAIVEPWKVTTNFNVKWRVCFISSYRVLLTDDAGLAALRRGKK